MRNADVAPHKKVGIPEALEAGVNPGPEKLEGPAIAYAKTGAAVGPVQRTAFGEKISPLADKQLDALGVAGPAPVRFRLPLV